MRVMRRLLITMIFALLCALCLAQSPFNTNIMNGDIKMKERFYEMAMTYYKKARSLASNGEEITVADRKIAECKRIIDEINAANAAKNVKSRLLFSEQYLDSGDIYSGSIDSYNNGAIVHSDEDAPLSLFVVEVYDDHIRILSHEDDSSKELGDIPAGTEIKLIKETSKYRLFASDEAGEEFLVYKRAHNNEFGRFHVALRKVGKNYIRLYSLAEVRKVMQASESDSFKSEDDKNRENSEQDKGATSTSVESENTSKEILPISFLDYWALNLDSNNIRLGDSRSEPLKADDVRWLTLRIRYSCPENYDNPIRFDVRVETPSGQVMKINGKGVAKGYSTYEVLETIPGGGIFSFAIGSDEPGTFKRGKYVIGIWHDDIQYYSFIVELQ